MANSGVYMDNIFLPKINFCMQFKKLHNQKTAELLSVKVVEINDKTSPDFINYDAVADDGRMYALKKGKHILLTFLGCKNIPFTTVRTYKADEEKYYKDNLNKTFNIIVSPC